MTKKNAENNNVKIIKDVASELLKLLGIDTSCEVLFDSDNDVYALNIDAKEEAGLLIGKKGETINAIQVVVNQILRQKKGEWVRVVVNVADFREKESSRMVELAQQTAARVRETGEPQNLYNLTPSQRRTVHLTLAEEKDLHTESVGEGLERYLIVSKK
jgi:spoIIIJ-associated protein